MPIYEYICEDCHQKFESMRPFSQADAPISCTNCKSTHTHRTVSKCFAKSDSTGTNYSVNVGGGCSGCSGGNCGHCGH